MKISEIKPEIYDIAARAEKKCAETFAKIDETAQKNTFKVMAAFQNNKVSEACFAGTTGYGYDDLGRETLDKIYAEIFKTEKAIVRIGFVNGTHALSTALYALAKPGQTIVAATGLPYDTLRNTIGIEGDCWGSLKFYGVNYKQVDLKEDGTPDIEGIIEACSDPTVSAVICQRSRGYADRKALTVEELGQIASAVKGVNPEIYVMADNCYGEFTDIVEPTEAGFDLIAGSLIKNPGGGIAPTGGYLAGTKELIERAEYRMTCPGIGGECGSTLGNNRLLFQGLFLAPHTTAQALKTAVFCAAMMDEIGISSSPSYDDKRSDIIQVVRLGSGDKMKKFCLGIQAGAPVDSYVTPEPWDMPGYNCPVIMAAGAFIQGSSIELSADGPFTEPYNVYMQGGLTYESGKLGIMMAVSAMMD